MKKVMRAVAAIMLMTASVFVAGCKPDDSNEGNGGSDVSGTYNGHDYVDLGLPSGTLWATCNLGADKPEGYGDYFAWGETNPKTVYSWDNYKYCYVNSQKLTKYCTISGYGYNGLNDGLTVLLPEDDAATSYWGAGWRMPTTEECQELMHNTTHTWTIRNDVYGRLFTGKNGNTLFLPAAGWYNGNSTGYVGELGYYWASLLDTGTPINACRFHFQSGGCGVGSDRRDVGQSVRAVRQ